MPDLRIFMLTKSRLPQFQTTKRVQQASKPASQQASKPATHYLIVAQKVKNLATLILMIIMAVTHAYMSIWSILGEGVIPKLCVWG
jgi:hypothetical protein